MSEWTWGFEPPDRGDHLPAGVLAEIERLADELASMGGEAAAAGVPTARGRVLRDLPLAGGRGFFTFMPVEHRREIVVVSVTLWS
ncbi:hypothetical protein [Streptomonospora arabica]|uniref:Uncharacterized protein n=1 Tax=Streptomonospora arabica TaxID=412417 RepID=A0ABV9SGQ9_9ACTN